MQRASLRSVILYFLLVMGVLSAASSAGSTTIDEVSRSTLVSNFVDWSGVATDSRAEGEQSIVAGAFLEATVDGLGFGDVTNASGEAIQDTTVVISPAGALRVEGSGSAGAVVDVNDPGFPSRAVSTSDSNLSIIFTIDEARPFILAVSLSADLQQASVFSSSASLGSEVAAHARLLGSEAGVIFESDVRDLTEGDAAVQRNVSAEGVLEPGTYLLEVLALTELRGFEDAAGLGVAGFGLDFRVVPEPGTALLIGLGLVGLSRCGRSRVPRVVTDA